jgi:hypothetical protein
MSTERKIALVHRGFVGIQTHDVAESVSLFHCLVVDSNKIVQLFINNRQANQMTSETIGRVSVSMSSSHAGGSSSLLLVESLASLSPSAECG